ncbi:AAA family ATPase [Paenibacillus sp. NPDC056933]|uniref:AAA family ATPase n=1 Tax=Paenibacillus sp. NPDC056933 TaxID=3345968 RepID=UPI0036384E01
MKLNKISVENLFGVFNHEIPINNERGTTIIIGENGLGKTVILEILESFFNSKFYYFNSVTFDKVLFEFIDNVVWTITKEFHEETNENYISVNTNAIESRSSFLIQTSDFNPQNLVRQARNLGSMLGMRRLANTRWEDRRTGYIYNAEELIERYAHLTTGYNFESQLEQNAPEWFTTRFNELNVTLIETQRLLEIDHFENAPIETVKKYSGELLELMKRNLTKSTELSSKLDRTYPNRLIKELGERKKNISDEMLNEKLNQLEEKRKLMDRVGLTETEKDSTLLKIDNPEEVVKDVLMLYIKDSFEKLSIYDEISVKIELLLKIINERFKHKRMYVNKENGFSFKSTVIKKEGDFQEIPIEKLSSGEKNELILFYKLIFKTDSNSLILIDEPEISLHISWQNKFISDLYEIHKLNKLDILIATHSPDIISNNWDLSIELKGVE